MSKIWIVLDNQTNVVLAALSSKELAEAYKAKQPLWTCHIVEIEVDNETQSANATR